jgi:septal ring factor EnvC (AmiA/AmiB activator)
MGTSGTCQQPAPRKPSSSTPPFPAKGAKLIPPNKESPAIAFNGTTRVAGKSRGLVWELKSLSEVISPAAGHVVHAGDFRGYGNLVIINAGSGYQLLIVGLSTLAVKAGDYVTAGALLGMTRKTDQPTGVNSTAANSVIYFELRKDGQPIDPAPWMYPIK